MRVGYPLNSVTLAECFPVEFPPVARLGLGRPELCRRSSRSQAPPASERRRRFRRSLVALLLFLLHDKRAHFWMRINCGF